MVLGNPSLGNLNTQENDINNHWYMIWMKFSSHLHYMKNKHWNRNIWYIERILTSRKNRQGRSFVVCIYNDEPTTKKYNPKKYNYSIKRLQNNKPRLFWKVSILLSHPPWCPISFLFAPLVFLDLYYWERVSSGAKNH